MRDALLTVSAGVGMALLCGAVEAQWPLLEKDLASIADSNRRYLRQ